MLLLPRTLLLLLLLPPLLFLMSMRTSDVTAISPLSDRLRAAATGDAIGYCHKQSTPAASAQLSTASTLAACASFTLDATAAAPTATAVRQIVLSSPCSLERFTVGSIY